MTFLNDLGCGKESLSLCHPLEHLTVNQGVVRSSRTGAANKKITEQFR